MEPADHRRNFRLFAESRAALPLPLPQGSAPVTGGEHPGHQLQRAVQQERTAMEPAGHRQNI
jgi:hypothetical protein